MDSWGSPNLFQTKSFCLSEDTHHPSKKRGRAAPPSLWNSPSWRTQRWGLWQSPVFAQAPCALFYKKKERHCSKSMWRAGAWLRRFVRIGHGFYEVDESSHPLAVRLGPEPGAGHGNRQAACPPRACWPSGGPHHQLKQHKEEVEAMDDLLWDTPGLFNDEGLLAPSSAPTASSLLAAMRPCGQMACI